MKNKGILISITILLILSIISIISPGGGGVTNSVAAIPANSPETNNEPQVISTLTEISSTIPALLESSITHQRLTIEIPPDSLPSDSTVKSALVTIHGSAFQGHEGYKFFTASPDPLIEKSICYSKNVCQF